MQIVLLAPIPILALKNRDRLLEFYKNSSR